MSMLTLLSDVALRQRGLSILFRELGEVDTVRFLSQIRHEPKDYIALQAQLFQGMTVDAIYASAKVYTDKKQHLS